jgi:hypothetical protein
VVKQTIKTLLKKQKKTSLLSEGWFPNVETFEEGMYE